MLRPRIALIFLVVLVAGGCGAHKAVAPASSDVQLEAKRTYVAVMGGRSALAASRYLAVRHRLAIVVAGSELPKALEAVTGFCGTIQCEVVSSNVTSQTGESAPAGNLSLRVRPADVDKLIAFVGKQGKVAQHTTETEDKTAIVVDTDAKIKNLTEFRDTLRKMLARPAVSVADAVQIQEKLADVQAQLDSEAVQRKILANETEKVAVEVEFRAERTTASVSAFRPIAEALRESASVLSESIASLITAVVAIVPWLIVIVPGGWLLLRAWRRSKKGEAVGV
jgi:Domain of unknown function (DUF4349)